MRPITAWDVDLSNETYDALEANEMREMSAYRKIKTWEQQINNEGGLEVHSCETAEEKVNLLTKLISEISADYERLRLMDGHYFERRLFIEMSDLHRLKVLQKRYQWQTWKQTEYDDITNEMIHRARSVPLEELLEVPRTKMILCFFHKDKNASMFVKNGFAYCFSCGAWCDSIKYMMSVKGMKFPEAVKALIR